jgi:hypothetical protein
MVTRMPDGNCGAKTRAGGACKRPPMKNGRCRLHGGMSTGAKHQNTAKNAVKHGIYCANLTPEELADHDSLQLGTVDLELRACRIRLQRALKAEAEAKGEAELDEVITRRNGIETDDPEVKKLHNAVMGAFAPYEEKKKVRDYVGIIDKIMARIESLEKTRAALLAAQQGRGEDETEDITRDDTTISPDEPIPKNPIL